jgi:hypothetical protein
MVQAGIDARHRDKNGQIGRKHGNTLIKTLRRIYGENFGTGFKDSDKLEDALVELDEPSLTAMLRDEEGGQLDGKIAEAKEE